MTSRITTPFDATSTAAEVVAGLDLSGAPRPGHRAAPRGSAWRRLARWPEREPR